LVKALPVLALVGDILGAPDGDGDISQPELLAQVA